MRDIIYLNSDIEVLVISFGGVGTSFLLKEIAKYKKTNSPGDRDYCKHLTIPPLGGPPNLKVIYIFGDPILATISLFNRRFHCSQSIKLQRFYRAGFLIPNKMTLEAYAKKGKDGFFFERHFNNWYEKHQRYPTLFLKYENLFDNIDTISEFLNLPPEFSENFPEKKVRNSDFISHSAETIKGLESLYGNFRDRLNDRKPVEILPEKQSPIWKYNAYHRAIVVGLPMKIYRFLFNKELPGFLKKRLVKYSTRRKKITTY